MLGSAQEEVPSRFERESCRRLVRRAVWRALELSRLHPPVRPALVARVLGLARGARAAHDHGRLDRLDQLLGVANRHWPLGVEMRLAALTDAPDLMWCGSALPEPPPVAHPEPRFALLVLFRPARTPLR
jgi:hypothetical protein